MGILEVGPYFVGDEVRPNLWVELACVDSAERPTLFLGWKLLLRSMLQSQFDTPTSRAPEVHNSVKLNKQNREQIFSKRNENDSLCFSILLVAT